MTTNQIKRIIKLIVSNVGSVRLAVPSMLILICVIAFGTIVESRYNAEYAKLLVYQSPWFNALIIVIWFNILFAALSRWPWKKHHIGFLITHLGLLLLFGGGFITNVWGVDGSLRVLEGQSANEVVLSDLVLGIQGSKDSRPVFYPIPKSQSSKGRDAFRDVNARLTGLLSIEGYEPFVKVVEQNKLGSSTGPIQEPIDVQFRLKSNFFDVNQSLNSATQPQLQMGPAQISLVKVSNLTTTQHGKPAAAKPASKAQASRPAARSSAAGSPGGQIEIKVGGQTKLVKVSLAQLPSRVEGLGFQIEIVRAFRQASVGQGGIHEGEGGKPNPALEVQIIKGGEKVRDVLFAQFSDFSLRKAEFPDLKLKYLPGDAAAMGSETASAPEPATPASAGPQPGGNQIQIFYSESTPDQIRIDLKKGDAEVGSKILKVNENLPTPWMGMQITLLGLNWGGSKETTIVPTLPEERTDQLPPSAIRIVRFEGAPAEENWLTEGDERQVSINGQDYHFYYGRKFIPLPFQLQLLKFKKTEYPGTAMAKEFESEVTVTGQASPIRISMNQPLEYAGYTLYQSSFEQVGQGQFASIFSVNRDPGRPFKYLGGIILAIGIITFTLMRSNFLTGRRLRKP